MTEKASPKPELKHAEYVAPVNKLEEDFGNIFEEVLNLEKVGAEDDFFELGGNSILAMKVVIAANKQNYNIVYNDVFNNTTPHNFSTLVGSESQKNVLNVKLITSDQINETGTDGYNYSAIRS